MLQWVTAIVVMLVVGGAGTWLARGPLRRRDETAAGITALSALSWREFIRLLLEALSRRGYQRLVDPEAPASDGDYTLVRKDARDDGQWLLAAKHGSAFVLGRAPVNELVAAMAVAGASGGFLVTQGRIDEAARQAARGHPVELLDGAALWPELRPLLPAPVLAPILEASGTRARQRGLAAWLVALVLGLAVFALIPTPKPVPPASATPTGADAGPSTGAPATTAADVPEADATAPTGTPDAQRRELASALATLPDVTRAVWSSSSTLEVFVGTAEEDPFTVICPLVERYPALASSRIQLTPPPGSGRAVRFRQCRSY